MEKVPTRAFSSLKALSYFLPSSKTSIFLVGLFPALPRPEEGGEEEQTGEAEDVASAVQEPVYEEVKLTAKVFDYKSKQFKKTDSQWRNQ